MTTEVSQLRPEGIEAATEFAKSVGCELQAKNIDPNISLIAQQEHEIIAAVIGVHNPGGACNLHVCLSKLDDPTQVTSDLLDKALMKVHGAGVRRCQFNYHGAEDQPVDWPGAKWSAQEDESADTPAVTEQTPEVEADTEIIAEVDEEVTTNAEAVDDKATPDDKVTSETKTESSAEAA